MSDEEKIEKWRASCADKNKKPKHDPEQGGKKEPLGEGCKTPNNEAQRDKPVIVGNHTSAILLKLTMLQEMHPIKFSGNPSDYPTFRNRLRDNLENGILKLEFLPKFLSGEAFEVVARVSGCSYDSVLRILHSEISGNFTNCDKNLREIVEDFCKLEAFGTQGAPGSREGEQVNRLSAPHNWSMEDMRAVETLQRTTRLSDRRYETGLLWRNEDVRLPNNRCEAETRMYSLKRRSSRDPDLEQRYRAVMKEYIGKGYTRKLSPEEADHLGARTWYLPHFPVINQNKPGKVRIVFDAAAEYNGTSLNKNLLQGSDSTNCLIGVLLRFRQENTAIVVDIESMFHQVRVPEDRDSLRFLWWDESTGDSLEEYVITVHIFGATDSPCVANSTLKRTANDNEKDFDAITVQTLRSNFYVDDLLKTVPTPATATRLVGQLIELCAKGGFNLTKFKSNDRNVLAQIPVEKRAVPALDLDLDELPVNRAIGVECNIALDKFSFTAMLRHA